MKDLVKHLIYEYAINMMFKTIFNNFNTVTHDDKYYSGQHFDQLITYKVIRAPGKERKQKHHYFNVQIMSVDGDMLFIAFDYIILTNRDNDDQNSKKLFGGMINIFKDEILMAI